jgi:CBS domain-containing protein
MSVAHILSHKGTGVVTAQPGDDVASICRILAENRVGAAVVTEPGTGAIAGIVSERDIVRALAGHGAGAITWPVSEIMTRAVVTCSPDDSIDALMAVMTERRIRHVPVVVQGRLSGIVSIGDVVKRRIEDAEREAEEIKRYIAEGA